MGQKMPPKTETRIFNIDRASVNIKDRTVPLSFSSETPVVRTWGIEILDHSPGCMRMDRAKSGISLLFNHNRDVLLGKLENVQCGDDRMGRGVGRFGTSDVATQSLKDAQDGILTDVSVGYQVNMVEEMPVKEMSPDLMAMAAQEKLPVYRITDWEPFECSLVTVPADPTVGVGRSRGTDDGANKGGDADAPDKAITAGEPKNGASSGASIIPREVRQMDPNTRTLEEHDKDVKDQSERAAKAAREQAEARVSGIYDLGRRFSNFVPQFIIEKAVREGMPLDEFQRMVLTRVETGKPIDTPVTELGLSKQEVQRYSITKAILGQWKESGVDASYERALHSELVKKGVEPVKGGILIPYDIMRQKADPGGIGRRDLSLASDAVGGYLKGTDFLGSEFIEILYNSMVLRRAGARVLSGLRGNVAIPKRTAGAGTYWVTDGNAPTEGANTFAQVTLTPKNIACNIDYTRQLLLQSNPSIDGLVNGDMAKEIALGVDLAGFHGTGTEQPQGIVGTPNVGATTATAINLAKMFDFQTDVAAANALTPGCAYITTPAVAAILASVPRFTYASKGLWDGNLLETNDCAGFRGFASNQITAGYCIFGDFSQLLIGEWGVLELVVDPYTQSKNGIVQVTAFQSVDIALRYPGAFSVSSSVTAPA